ncbi:hypothetical protein POP12_018 [Pectobacterium phage POP12]|nr:hypothetical protein POP12_018 [Pectobacterium phage POP12]
MNFLTNDYLQIMKKSLANQIGHAASHYGLWTDVKIFSTSLDMGRQSGKSRALGEWIPTAVGKVIMVSHTIDAGDQFKRKYNLDDEKILFSSPTNIHHKIRGRNWDTNAVTLIFDECDMRSSDMYDIAHTVCLGMQTNGCWGKFVHIVRVGY